MHAKRECTTPPHPLVPKMDPTTAHHTHPHTQCAYTQTLSLFKSFDAHGALSLDKHTYSTHDTSLYPYHPPPAGSHLLSNMEYFYHHHYAL